MIDKLKRSLLFLMNDNVISKNIQGTVRMLNCWWKKFLLADRELGKK